MNNNSVTYIKSTINVISEIKDKNFRTKVVDKGRLYGHIIMSGPESSQQILETFNECKKLFKISSIMECYPPKVFYRGPALFHVINDSVDVLTFAYFTKNGTVSISSNDINEVINAFESSQDKIE